MAKNKFSEIYEVLKEEILDGKYTSNMMLPLNFNLLKGFHVAETLYVEQFLN